MPNTAVRTTPMPNPITQVKELWSELMMWHEEMQWKNSPERRELAVKRLEIYRKFMSGDKSCITNPYQDPEAYNFY